MNKEITEETAELLEGANDALNTHRQKFLQRFLTNTDATGRFIVVSKRTGKTYAVEPIGNVRTNWGDVDSSYQKVSGDYGDKYPGYVKEDDSLITSESCINIQTLEPGTSPLHAIEVLDAKYPSI